MRYVILPQALRIAVPPTVGFLVQLVKATALASIVGFNDLTRAGTIVTNATFQPLLVYGLVAVIYFAMCYPLTSVRRHSGAKAGSDPASRNRLGIVRWNRNRHPIQPDTSAPMVELRNVSKWYGTFQALKDVSLIGAQGRADGHLRTVRLGQIHRDPLHQPAGAASGGPNPGRRHRTDAGLQEYRPDPPRSRHGVSAVQPVPAFDRASESDAGAAQGAQAAAQGSGRTRHALSEPGADLGTGAQISKPAVRRPAAARGDRARAVHGAAGDAVRRADIGSRSGNDQGSARCHDRAGGRAHDHDLRHPRDGLRPHGRRYHGLHGSWRRSSKWRRPRRSSQLPRASVRGRSWDRSWDIDAYSAALRDFFPCSCGAATAR